MSQHLNQSEIQTTFLLTLRGLTQTMQEQQSTLAQSLDNYMQLEQDVTLMQNNELKLYKRLDEAERRIVHLNSTAQTLLNYVQGLQNYESALHSRANLLKNLEKSVIEPSQLLESSVQKLTVLLTSAS